MGGRGAAVTVLMAAAVTGVLLEGSVFAAAKHIVGGSTGWTIPTNASFYSDWASSQLFDVGDTLVFNYPTGIHNVIQVPKSGYDACSFQSQIGPTQTAGPSTVTLSSAGARYYICGVGTHCALGQKLAITVAAASSPAPSPSPIAGGPAPESPAGPTSPAAGASAAAGAPGPSASGHSTSGAPAVQPGGSWFPAMALLSAAAVFLLH